MFVLIVDGRVTDHWRWNMMDSHGQSATGTGTRDQNIRIQSRVWGGSEKATVGYRPMYDYGNGSNTENHHFNSDAFCNNNVI